MSQSRLTIPATIPKTILALVRMIAGLLIWASALIVLYAGQTLLCRHVDISAEAVTVVLIGLALAHFAALGLLSMRWHSQRPSEQMEFCHRLEGLILITSALALLWLALPLLWAAPCA